MSYLRVCLCYLVSLKARRCWLNLLGRKFIDSGELPCECWELNPGHLKASIWKNSQCSMEPSFQFCPCFLGSLSLTQGLAIRAGCLLIKS